MKRQLGLVGLSAATLFMAGCASMVGSPSTKPAMLQAGLDPRDQQQLNLALTTAIDGQPVIWHSTYSDTDYHVTTMNTYVNQQGMPCRYYHLVVDPTYGFTKQISAEACRNNGQWQIVK